MYQRVLMSLTLTVAFSLAIFVQATSARTLSSQVSQESPLVSEKLAGLNPVVAAKPIVSEKLAGMQLPTASTTTYAVSTGSEFDWSDAGIGAGFVLGTMLLGTALVITVRRRDFPIAH